MALHAEQFFTQQLDLTDGTVIGDTYYATRRPDSPLRLRISFSRTIRAEEYDGLRLQILHADQGGVLDTVLLTFADHATFHSRDAAIGRLPGYSGYAKMRDWHERDDPPWQGAATTKLRRAIEQYTLLWFPQLPAPPRPETAVSHRTLSGHPPAPEPNTLTEHRPTGLRCRQGCVLGLLQPVGVPAGERHRRTVVVEQRDEVYVVHPAVGRDRATVAAADDQPFSLGAAQVGDHDGASGALRGEHDDLPPLVPRLDGVVEVLDVVEVLFLGALCRAAAEISASGATWALESSVRWSAPARVRRSFRYRVAGVNV